MWLAVEIGKSLHFVIQARRFQHILSKMCGLKGDMVQSQQFIESEKNGVQKQPILQLL